MKSITSSGLQRCLKVSHHRNEQVQYGFQNIIKRENVQKIVYAADETPLNTKLEYENKNT